MARQGDIEAEAELYHGPQLPPLAAHVMDHWIALSATRTSSGFGPNPITRHDVHAWESDEGVTLSPWERRAIFRIDEAWRRSQITKEA